MRVRTYVRNLRMLAIACRVHVAGVRVERLVLGRASRARVRKGLGFEDLWSLKTPYPL